MRKALGVAVFSGMLGVTFFGIFLTPVFFSVIEWLANSRLFASTAARRVSDMLLGVLALGHPVRIVRWARRSRATTSSVEASAETPIEVFSRELADLDRFLADGASRGESANGNGNGERPGPGEKMVVLDHQRGKTNITVIQHSEIAAPGNGHGSGSEQLSAPPIIADLAVAPPPGLLIPPADDPAKEMP
jgi:hypothetical protein